MYSIGSLHKLNSLTIATFWRNQLASVGSPVATSRWRPIALKMTPVDSKYTLMVSSTIDSNW